MIDKDYDDNFSIELDSELISRDIDEVEAEPQHEESEETDILME